MGFGALPCAGLAINGGEALAAEFSGAAAMAAVVAEAAHASGDAA